MHRHKNSIKSLVALVMRAEHNCFSQNCSVPLEFETEFVLFVGVLLSCFTVLREFRQRTAVGQSQPRPPIAIITEPNSPYESTSLQLFWTCMQVDAYWPSSRTKDSQSIFRTSAEQNLLERIISERRASPSQGGGQCNAWRSHWWG